MPNIDEARHEYVEDTKLASREIEEHVYWRIGQPAADIIGWQLCKRNYLRFVGFHARKRKLPCGDHVADKRARRVLFHSVALARNRTKESRNPRCS